MTAKEAASGFEMARYASRTRGRPSSGFACGGTARPSREAGGGAGQAGGGPDSGAAAGPRRRRRLPLGRLSAASRPPLGRLSAASRPPLGRLSAACRPRRGPRLGRSTLELGRLRVALHAAALPPLGRLLALGRGAKTAGRLLGEQLRRRNFRRRGGKDRPDRRAEAVIRGAGRRHAPLGRIGRIRHPAQRVDARVDLHAVGERQPRLPQPQPVAGREEVVGEVEQVQRGGDEVVVAPHRPHRRHVQPALGGRRLARPPG